METENYNAIYYPKSSFFATFIVLIAVEVFLFKLTSSDFVYIFILPIIHFFYIYRDCKIEISNQSIKLYTILKKSISINNFEIEEIYIESTKIKSGVLGPIKIMNIYTKNCQYRFDIYRFEQKLLIDSMKNIENENTNSIIDEDSILS